MAADEDRDDIRREFSDLVNMTPSELERWLDTDESKSVGESSGDGESTGHKSGRRIVKILQTKKDDLTDGDVDHMRTVRGYINGIWPSARLVMCPRRRGATA